jgi:hypothetical protein
MSRIDAGTAMAMLEMARTMNARLKKIGKRLDALESRHASYGPGVIRRPPPANEAPLAAVTPRPSPTENGGPYRCIQCGAVIRK